MPGEKAHKIPTKDVLTMREGPLSKGIPVWQEEKRVSSIGLGPGLKINGNGNNGYKRR